MTITKLLVIQFITFSTISILLYSCQSKEIKTFPLIENITATVYASGKIKSDNQYQLYSTVNGILSELFVEKGIDVKKGDPVARISSDIPKINLENARAQASYSSIENNIEKIEQAKKEMRLAKIRLDNEESLLNRQKLLWADEIGSKNELDIRMLSYETALTNYNSRIVQLEDLEKQLNLCFFMINCLNLLIQLKNF